MRFCRRGATSDGGIDPRIVTTAGGGVPTVPAGQAGVGPIKCRQDFLVLSVDRLCGERLNDAAASSTLTDNADVTGQRPPATRRGRRQTPRQRDCVCHFPGPVSVSQFQT